MHGLWLLLAGWIALVLAVAGVGFVAGADAGFWSYIAGALLIGFEAPTLRRVRLGRRGWRYRGELFAVSGDLAAVAWLQRR